MINEIYRSTVNYIDTVSRDQRKKIGQFFTPVETAIFMASLFHVPDQGNLAILDPGAGSGILTAAVLDRLQDTQGIRSVTVTCYETNEDILPLLRENLELMKAASKVPMSYRICDKNYIVSQGHAFQSRTPEEVYDMVISNPPYKKLPLKAEEVQAMKEVCYGAPNLYFLFAAMALFNLRSGGEMVFIIPRSLTSGG